ncbi:aminotransferase class V-fold PLP-dependent enzyme [Virgibacillus sp. SK37]|uniref:aminotransferase class V-fold PLP-dependent enzyme n=1 Tax=Virgibacillus sp. SK37 TaxID=403957 RepID=UPI0004D1E091|nr:aminotransferase class V-fold PLP-dependent enzyme [Virgibacillus sp. SK37]AIF43083.1 aminotransferase V [Virgibacillus sp. SK37]
MKERTSILYKLADDKAEIDQIHQLNYETFVEEIPQHERNNTRILVDRFHEQNTYVIAKLAGEVIGMITVRGERPFSLDQKLSNLDEYLPAHAVPCEIRLLSIKKRHRGGSVFYGLCEKLVSYCLEQGFNMALISGTTRQTRLYKHIGFKPFGPLVGTKEAPYQPMYLTVESFEKSTLAFQRLMKREKGTLDHCFLPGPVSISDKVKEAFERPAISHRSEKLLGIFQDVRQELCNLTNASFVEIAVGTGTLANEMVAAQLSTLKGKGLILSNGEFGDRLIQQANKWQLDFETLQKPWNMPITAEEVKERLETNDEIDWLWSVHCETSTGFLFPLEELKIHCKRNQVRLCLDACSSLGILSIDLQGVYLAASVSGKGVGSYPGLALVFHEEQLEPNGYIPSYLDLGLYQSKNGVPFTHSSNGLLALHAALKQLQPASRELAARIFRVLTDEGMDVIWGENYSPGILTICLPDLISSNKFGEMLRQQGVHISYQSSYLLNRNWIQVALMGEQPVDKVMKAIDLLISLYHSAKEKEGSFQ